MPLVVRAYPLRRPVSELQSFAATLTQERKSETQDFYRKYGVSHESWYVQETPNGDWVIAVAVIDDPAGAGARYAESTAAFDSWFKGQVEHLSGVDLQRQPLGPPTREVFAWSDDERPRSNLAGI